MGRDVAEASKEAMELWKKAEQISGLPLRAVYWESDDAALMADTKHLQPALTVVNVTLWQALSGKLSPACAAGHSLGEYSALAAAGALSPESTLELVSLRGKLMADADPDGKGGMAAILKLNREAVNEIAKAAAEATGEILIVANHNTPAQFVISGTKAAVEAALPLVKEKKGRAVSLPVSGAFHSPLMDTAAQELAKALNKMTWSRPRFPVYSNVTGKAVTDGESLRELATVQMISSVLWIDTIANQWHDGIRSWVEVGPKGTLSRMVKPILDAVPAGGRRSPITAVGSLEGVNAFRLIPHCKQNRPHRKEGEDVENALPFLSISGINLSIGSACGTSSGAADPRPYRGASCDLPRIPNSSRQRTRPTNRLQTP